MQKNVKAIPDGYHTITPYLVVSDGARAIEFYKKAFGAQQIFRMDAPGGKVMHAEIKIGDSIFMLTEESPETGCLAPTSLKGNPLSLYLYVEDVDGAFNQAVKAGAKVLMPVQDMFWGDRYGQVSDPSGHRWSLATHKQDLTPEQVEEGAKKFFAQRETQKSER